MNRACWLVRLAAVLVPRARRGDWIREWSAELEALRSRQGRPAPLARVTTPRRIAWAILRDALALRRQRRQRRSGGGGAPGNRATVRVEERRRPLARLGLAAADVRFATRTLRHDPGFAAAVIATLAIGIAATSTIFTFVDAILLRPLPYPEPDRLVAVWPSFWFSSSSFRLLDRDIQASDSNAFLYVAGYSPRSARLRNGDGDTTVYGPRVTARFFDVLGSPMTLGRGFAPDANDLGSEPGVVVMHAFWQRELAADPGAVGTRILLDSTPHTVRGVLAPGADLLQHGAQLAVPKRFDPSSVRDRSSEMKVIGRLRPGATVQQARAQLDAQLAVWRTEYGLPDDFGKQFTVVPLRDSLVGQLVAPLWLLWGSVVVILLMAGCNVVNLLLVKAIAREPEVWVRLALGARRSGIVRRLLVENTLLALLGGLVGLGAAAAAVALARGLLPPNTPRLEEVSLDARVAGFAVIVALGLGLLITIAPALRSLSGRRLRGSYSRSDDSATRRFRQSIVGAEVALTVLLLICSGLLVKSFFKLSRVDAGIDANDLSTFYVDAERGRLKSPSEAAVFHQSVTEQLRALPGVRGVSTVSQAPYNDDGGVVGCNAVPQEASESDETTRCRWRSVGPGYFSLSGTHLLEGRVFTADDNGGAEPVAIISHAAARRLLPGRSAVGAQVATGFEAVVEGGPPSAQVVGVVADVRFLGLAEQAPLVVYRAE